MPFDPQDFLSLAQSIAIDYREREAALRTAVGRAYYSAFLQAREKLGVRRIRVAHGWVRGEISRRGDKTTADQLASLEELRNIADYNLSPDAANSDWAANWNRAQELASDVLRTLSQEDDIKP